MAYTFSSYNEYSTSATNYVWSQWAEEYHGSTTTATITATGMDQTQDAVWRVWTSDGTGDACGVSYYTVQDQVWKKWAGDVEYEYEGGKVIYTDMETWKPPKKTTEQIRAENAQREINKIWSDILIMEEHRAKEEAEVTAQELLQELISEEELAYYKEHGELLVRGRKHDYIIRKGSGVIRVEKDKVYRLCVHLKEQYKYPQTDNVIALMLEIMADEHKFNKTANASNLSDKAADDYKNKVEELRKIA